MPVAGRTPPRIPLERVPQPREDKMSETWRLARPSRIGKSLDLSQTQNGGGWFVAGVSADVGRTESVTRTIAGREVVRHSLAEPLRWIAINAGYEGEEVVESVVAAPVGHGFNALTGKYGDMADFGVLDALTVTRTALESAASIAALLITTETAIVEEVVVNPGSIYAPGFGDLAEGLVRPSNIY